MDGSNLRYEGPFRRGPRLPPELVSMVINNLHDDKPTLSSTSLVAHYWAISSRPHLFRSIQLVLPPYFRASYRTSDNHLLAFLAFLKSAPDICIYITELLFRPPKEYFSISLTMSLDSPFVSIIRCLGSLDTLTLERNALMAPRDSEIVDVETPLIHLSHLKLRWMGACEGCFEFLLGICPPQETLQIFQSSFNAADQIVLRPPRQVMVHHYKFKGGDGAYPENIDGVMFPRLTAISMDIGLNEHAGRRFHIDIGHLLRQCGPRLQHFRLNVSELAHQDNRVDDTWDLFQIASICPALQSLHLGFRSQLSRNGRVDEESRQSLDLILRVLVSAPMSLSTVVFGIHITGQRDPASAVNLSMDPQALADVLDIFPKLTSVKFMMHSARSFGAADMDEFLDPLDLIYQSYFAEKLPTLRERGILHFE